MIRLCNNFLCAHLQPASQPGLYILLLAALLMLVACLPDLRDPPRQATQTALPAVDPLAEATPVISAAPTPTTAPQPGQLVEEDVEPEANPSITLWVNETSAEHRQAIERMIAGFNQSHDIQVEVMFVAPRRLPDLMQAAATTNTLPDLVLHPLEYTPGWFEQGLLDSQAASDIVAQLGRESFESAALRLVSLDQNENDGPVKAIPLNGWPQLLVYRADWFEARDLAPPVHFDDMMAAADAIFEADSPISGLVVPTDADLVDTQQIFEQIAIANGCQLIDEQGEVLLLHPDCLEALEFYREIINEYSPIGFQTDVSAINAYLAGRTGFIMGSPAILSRLAGLDEDYRPVCPECEEELDYLARHSGIVTEIHGRSEAAVPAAFGQIHYLGVAVGADREAAAQFAHYWLTDAYLDWLSVNPERKIPMRRGTVISPTHFVDGWRTLPLAGSALSLQDIYGAALVDQLEESMARASRWGFSQGQGAVMTRLYEELVFSILLQEMLSGYFTSSQTIVEAYRRAIALIPDYPYAVDLPDEEG